MTTQKRTRTNQTAAIFCLALILTSAIARPLPTRADQAAITAISGTVTNVSGDSITVKEADNPPAVYTVTPKTNIFIDGNPSAPTDLAPGLIVNIEQTGTVMTAIYARRPNTDTWGKILTISPTSITIATSSAETDTYSITPSTAFTLYDKPAGDTDLKPGMLADVKYTVDDATTAVGIDVVVPNGGLARGKIVDIENDTITLQSFEAGVTTYKLTKTTTVMLDDKPSKVGALKLGEFAKLTSDDGTTALTITASDKPHPGGGHGGHRGGSGGGSAPGRDDGEGV